MKAMHLSRLHAALVVTVLISPLASSATAQGWVFNGRSVVSAPEEQGTPRITSDGAGGAIITWQDERSGTNIDIYAQRLDAAGVPQWGTDGIGVCTEMNYQFDPVIHADGAGGAFIVWLDTRNGGDYDLYMQRVNAAGVPQWATDGIVLVSAPFDQSSVTIAADDAGGAIVSWQDARAGTWDIYAQRVNAAGVVQWTVGGVLLCSAVDSQYEPVCVADGTNGAVVAWLDFRSGTGSEIYAQRVNGAGVPLWTVDGVGLCSPSRNPNQVQMVADGAAGAIVTWEDYRSGTGSDIYAQRVDASGVPQWAVDGVGLCTAANRQQLPAIAADGTGGAIVTWFDERTFTNSDIYVQRVNAAGARQWTVDGVALCTAANAYAILPVIAADNAGGAVVSWEDSRSGDSDIYAQRIDAAGNTQWTDDGVALTMAANDQRYAAITTDGASGAIVAWHDRRSGFSQQSLDVYAQRVEGRYGFWGRPEPVLTSANDIPNDQGGRVAVNWQASGRDLPVPATIDFYSVWRAVDMAAVAASPTASSAITTLEHIDRDTPPGARIASPPYFWELVGTQTAYRWDFYSFSASTRSDSVVGDPAVEFFMVAAHDRIDEHIAFQSNALGGYSVDDLAPAAPLLLTAQRVGSDVQLQWRTAAAPDRRDYAIYRATASGVTPVVGNFLASSPDTLLVDAGAPLSTLYYIVTAYDIHANQSPASNEASVSASSGIGNTPRITALTVLPNHPNPFTGSTDFVIGLPVDSDVSIEIFDVAGSLVRRIAIRGARAGWQRIPFSSRAEVGKPLAGGVYLYRVTAAGATVTQKLVIAK